MSTRGSRVPVMPGELRVGMALPWPVYGQNGALIAARGFVIPDEESRQHLMQLGVLRDMQRLKIELENEGLDSRYYWSGDDPLAEFRHNVEAVQLTVQLHAFDKSTQLRAEWLGKLPPELLMISAPPLPGNESWRDIEPGYPIGLRLITARTAYRMEVPLLRHITLPAPMLFLRYPTTVDRQQVRQQVRLSTRIKAVAILSPGDQLVVSIVNISGDGCALEAEYPIGDIGQAIDLVFRIELRGRGYTLSLPAIIKNQRRRRMHIITGVAFGHLEEPLEESLRLALEAYLYEQLIAR